MARLRSDDVLDGLRFIGVDELSYRRHHEYVTVVVDHERGAVVWAREGKDAATLSAFFQELGNELEAVTLDLSAAYIKAVTGASPEARLIFDRFHVQRLAHDALDQVRRQQWRAADADDRDAIKGTRFVLQKNPWNLSDVEQGKLTDVQRTNRPLYRAYLLKETLAGPLSPAGEARSCRPPSSPVERIARARSRGLAGTEQAPCRRGRGADPRKAA